MSINDDFLERGARLKAERRRLKLTQPDVADLLDVAVGSIVRYEKQGDPLNQNQILVLHKAGFDMVYVTYGIHMVELSENEFKVLESYRSLKGDAQVGFVGMCKAYASQNIAV